MKGSILVLTELFLPTKGGTAVWFDEVYRRLGGKDIHIVTAAVPGDEGHDSAHPNRIHRLALERVRWLRPESLLMYLRMLATGIALMLRHRFDAVHAGRALPEGLVGWLLARIFRRSLLVYAHGEELTSWGRGRKYQVMCFVLRRADAVIANSSFTRHVLFEMGVPLNRISLIHPGVDTARFRPDLPVADLRERLGIGDDPLLLSVGRLSRRKGFDQAIHAVARLVAEGHPVQYAIIGIGEDRDYLASLVESLNLQTRVHLLGHVPMEELPRWYNACTCFVLPNRDIDGDTEGFGMVFLEAAACGRTALAGDAGGTGSAVLHEETGLRVCGESVNAIHAALHRLLTDVVLRTRLETAARVRARDAFSWEMVAQRTRSLGQSGTGPVAAAAGASVPATRL